MNNFEAEREEYKRKISTDRGKKALIYIINIFKKEHKPEPTPLLLLPRNDQELRIADSVVSIVMDELSLFDPDILLATDNSYDSDFLVEYMNNSMVSYIHGDNQIDVSPATMARYLYERDKSILVGKANEATQKLWLRHFPTVLIFIINVLIFIIKRSFEDQKTVNDDSITNEELSFEFKDRVLEGCAKLYGKEIPDYLEEVAEEFHKLFQQEYGERGFQYRR